MDVGEEAEAKISGYLKGYAEGYRAGVEYCLKTVREQMQKAGLIETEKGK